MSSRFNGIGGSHWSTIRTRPKALKSVFFFVVAFAIPRITKSFRLEKSMFSRLYGSKNFRNNKFYDRMRKKRREYLSIFPSILTKLFRKFVFLKRIRIILQWLSSGDKGRIETSLVPPWESNREGINTFNITVNTNANNNLVCIALTKRQTPICHTLYHETITYRSL